MVQIDPVWGRGARAMGHFGDPVVCPQAKMQLGRIKPREPRA